MTTRRTFLFVTAATVAAALPQARAALAATTPAPVPYFPGCCSLMYDTWEDANGTGWAPAQRTQGPGYYSDGPLGTIRKKPAHP